VDYLVTFCNTAEQGVMDVRTKGGLELLLGYVRMQDLKCCVEAAAAIWRCAERGNVVHANVFE